MRSKFNVRQRDFIPETCSILITKWTESKSLLAIERESSGNERPGTLIF